MAYVQLHISLGPDGTPYLQIPLNCNVNGKCVKDVLGQFDDPGLSLKCCCVDLLPRCLVAQSVCV